MATKPNDKTRHSDPLEGEDARRFVAYVDRDERREFVKASRGVFRKVFSPRPASDLFEH